MQMVTQMNPGNIMVSEINQSQAQIPYDSIYMNSQIHRDRKYKSYWGLRKDEDRRAIV